jgi:sugar lactone lactonase YvrE
MSRHPKPIIATHERCVLAEGPVWDPIRERRLWVDIINGVVFSGALAVDGRIAIRDSFSLGETTSAVAPSRGGDWLIAGAERLYLRRVDGTVTEGPRILPAGGRRRLNDGKPDPAGRFVVGSLSLAKESSTEQLVLVDGDLISPIDSDLTLSNGLAWSAGGTFFSVDTFRRVVYRRPWDAGKGTWRRRTTHLSLDGGLPHGICLDVREHLWIAMWGAGEVRRYSPSGDLVARVEVPAPHVTSVAFAGTELDTLVITTATSELPPDQLERFPASGALFTLKPGVRSLPQPLWAGPTSTGTAVR